MAVFKIGDRVVVVSRISRYHGQTGTITGVQRADDQHDTVDSYVVELDSGQLEFFTSTDLERILRGVH